MFDAAHRRLHRCPQVTPFFLIVSTAATSLHHLHRRPREAQMATFIPFAHPRRTALHQRTGLTDTQVEVGAVGA